MLSTLVAMSESVGYTNLRVTHRKPASELLRTPGGLLNRSHLRELGLEPTVEAQVFNVEGVDDAIRGVNT